MWKTGLGEGFRVPALLRFVNGENPYLGMSNGGPRMHLNMEDHVSHTLKKPNVPFEVTYHSPCTMPGRQNLIFHQAVS